MEALALIFVVMLVLGLFAFLIWSTVFWVLMLIDVARRDKWNNESEQVMWIVIILAIGFIGAVAYYYAVLKPRGKAVDKLTK